MGKIKIYDIVTNDEYELPVKLGVVGCNGIAEFLEDNVNTVRKRFPGKYKVIIAGEYKRKPQSVYYKRWLKKHDRTEYFKRRWREKGNERTMSGV